MKKRGIAALLAALLMTLTLSPAALAAESVDLAAVTAENYRAGVYHVSDAKDLENLSRLVAAGVDFAGSRILLTGDIDLTGAEVHPIGGYAYPYASSTPFNGRFEGQGHVIRGVSNSGGLFGCVGKEGVVRWLEVEGVFQNKDGYAGGVAIYNYGLVEHCVNRAEVHHHDNRSAAGGIVGANYGIVRGCTNEGAVLGHKAGGIVGIHPTGAMNPVVEGSANFGKISGSSNGGGIIGVSQVTSIIRSCENRGLVFGNGGMGGIVGMAGNTTVQNCFNRGDVGGTGDLGGIAGAMVYGAFLQNCYSTARVEGIGNAGGLVGQKADGKMQNCYWLYDINITPNLGTKNMVGYDFNSIATVNCCPFTIDGGLWYPSGANGIFMGEQTTGPAYTSLIEVLNVWVESFARQTCFNWTAEPGSTYPVLLEQAISPTATPGAGGYEAGTPVELTTETDDAVIWYTLDGTAPVPNVSHRYTEPIHLAATTTVKAIAVKAGMENSPVATEIYFVGSVAPELENPGMVAVLAEGYGSYRVLRQSLVQGGIITTAPGIDALAAVPQNLGRSFEDTAGHWSADAVRFVTARNLFLGVTDTEFAPDAAMTRGMLVTVMHRLEEEPAAAAPAVFHDVAKSDYFANGVAWAAETGLVNGVGDDLFAPGSSITREQLIAILYRYAAAKGFDVSATDDLSGFSDAGQLSAYAEPALRWAVGSGVFYSENGLLDARANATRAQVAQMLMNFGNVYWRSR
ncbi:MAG: S-layer homology domain-containing protein [Clostridia bacterium]|nr:S-layer homology domain-containing protein [Clostridia bacterium]